MSINSTGIFIKLPVGLVDLTVVLKYNTVFDLLELDCRIENLKLKLLNHHRLLDIIILYD